MGIIREILPHLLRGLQVTLFVSILSLLFSTCLGFALGLCRASQNRMLSRLASFYSDIFRGTPILVQIFIIFFILPEQGINFEELPAAVLTLTLYSSAYISEIVASGIKSIPKGQTEAALATGLGQLETLRYVILPQAVPILLPALVGQYVHLIKTTSIVSAIGVTDLVRTGWQTVQRIPHGLLVFGMVGGLYFLICYPLVRLMTRLEKRIVPVTRHHRL